MWTVAGLQTPDQYWDEWIFYPPHSIYRLHCSPAQMTRKAEAMKSSGPQGQCKDKQGLTNKVKQTQESKTGLKEGMTERGTQRKRASKSDGLCHSSAADKKTRADKESNRNTTDAWQDHWDCFCVRQGQQKSPLAPPVANMPEIYSLPSTLKPRAAPCQQALPL